MEIVFGTLCFMLLVFPKLIDSAWPHKEGAIHPIPIQLNIHDFNGTFLHSPQHTMEGIWYAGTEKARNREYIIGVIIARHLCPIMAPRRDLNHNYEKVKVRIDGNVANVTTAIPEEDPLNDLFYKEFSQDNICAVEIHE